MNRHAWLIAMILCIACVTGFAGQLRKVTISQQSGKISLYFAIEGSFTHKVFTLANPERVVLDLTNTSLGVNLNQLSITNSLIRSVRSGLSGSNTLRLVLDVNKRVRVLTSPWQQDGYNGIRLDMIQDHNNSPMNPKSNISFPKKSSAVKPIKLSTKTTAKIIDQKIITHQKPITVQHSPSNKHLRDVVVVLDAGHGGKDPGAKGPGHSQEKNVVLAITLRLKRLIDRQPGMHAVLTRSGDYYVGLRKRLDIARKYNGDVFVSIHADAFNNPHSSGASVFALSQGGATSEAARWLAEKENYSELGGVNLGDLDDSNGVVRSVLIDLSQTATINSGLQMGGRVLGQLNRFTHLHNNKVEQARFVVLKSPDIPSVLVETGFISNPREERNLTNVAYQDRLSQAIFQGIKTYFWDNPPHGTRIEAMTSNRFHLVRSGETIPAIAARYHVSITALLAMNHLPGNRRINPGQKLLIPSTWA